MNGRPIRQNVAVNIALSFVVIAAAGCVPPSDNAPGDNAPSNNAPSENAALDNAALADSPSTNLTATPSPRELRSIDADGLNKFLRQHRGKIVLIDFWATWCQPCVEGYPHTQRLSETYASSNVIVAAVAIDDPSNRSEIENFIAAQDASFPNFIARNGDDLVQAMDDFQIQTGTLPTLKLYDQDGSLHRTFGDGDPEPIRFEEIEVTIRALLVRRPT